MIFLSYLLNEQTPTYGNSSKFEQRKNKDMAKGDIANDTSISTTVHIGTHIDMPYHFHKNGQTIEDYNANFWIFKNPLIIEVEAKSIIIYDELIEKLDNVDDYNYDLLIVKTNICEIRDSEKFYKENYGFHPNIYDYLIKKFPNIKIFGFDSISVSSFQNRLLGREAHKKFLNPKNPILLLEDMDLRGINEKMKFKEIIISPLRISNCDGLPCTVFAKLDT